VNYFSFHIGDYAVHTRHLTPMEDLAYRRILDLYYLREGCLPGTDAEVARLVSLREYVDEVNAVLLEFFPDGHNKRADEEIAKYREKADRNREIGKLGGRPPKPTPNPDGTQTVSSENPDVTLTKNQEPRTNKEKAPAAPSLSFGELESEGLTRETAVEFLALRNRKRARLTRRAWEPIKTEIQAAGWTVERGITECLVRGWVAFKADWVKTAAKPADAARTTVPADPSSFNRTREAPQTPEQKEAANRARLLAISSLKNITKEAA
jgi:uncharacterized protein YdaU (DUF1376 family)